MIINRNNVVDYINFLYQKRMNQPAPADLLNSWRDLTENEVAIHLNGLYTHWNLDAITAKNYEQEFATKGGKTPIMPPVGNYNTGSYSSAQPQPTYNYPPPQPEPTKKSNAWIWIILLLIAVAAAGLYYYNLQQKDTSVDPEIQQTDTTQVAKPVVEKPQPIEPAAPQENEADKENAREVRNLLMAEENRNFDEIYAHFSPNMERYWDINYPTYDELRDRYQHSWDITDRANHSDVKVTKVGTNTYDVSSTYSYFSVKDQVEKTVKSKVRYVFDNSGRIIKTYGL